MNPLFYQLPWQPPLLNQPPHPPPALDTSPGACFSKVLILNRQPAAVLAWVDEVCATFPEMRRAVPCHFDAPVACSPRALRDAFSFLETRVDSQTETQMGAQLEEVSGKLEKRDPPAASPGAPAARGPGWPASLLGTVPRFFSTGRGRRLLPAADLAFLREFEATLVKAGTIFPSGE